jgi:excisionase family DNA binding protein
VIKTTLPTGIERWVSLLEIADHLGVSKETIYRRVSAKEIPAHKIGKLWKFKISEVDTHLKKRNKE